MKSLFFLSCLTMLIFYSCTTNSNSNITADSNDTQAVSDTVSSVIDTGNIKGRWNLIPAIASDTATGRLPYLVFDTSKVSGNTGCNNFSGRYKQSGNNLIFDANMISTKMACPGYDEASFVKNLIRATGYDIKGDTLVLKEDVTPLSYWLKGE